MLAAVTLAYGMRLGTCVHTLTHECRSGGGVLAAETRAYGMQLGTCVHTLREHVCVYTCVGVGVASCLFFRDKRSAMRGWSDVACGNV